ncbi:helix-turn-helix transcriptional regulator [Micromonospora sp. WMMD961]|uniref:helix-turn-helix transcriptional regulator n=1 Tax=Micromonospora sp. WMMD961 TaxID=3016100 RepID=UPI00241726EB|nr:helix-turn-helix transcriptional regulator [Micromonospora sp. WMMD961]MDG4779508.1 helix-turn-helix transcriptional regulator [Micromonospora sp. WMMD961]
MSKRPASSVSNPLAEFLRASRARIQPDDVGLPGGGRRRRVPGLRREEVAQLANVSADYLARLEQGRVTTASPEVLDALADALGLDRDGREYLHSIAGPKQRPGSRTQTTSRVDPQTQRLLDSLYEIPAYVFGRRLDILAWNPLAAALFTDYGALPERHRNLVWLTFLDPGYRELNTDWARAAQECVAYLRMEARNYPSDQRLAELVGTLCVKDADFRAWWGGHLVTGATLRRKIYQHPLVGPLALDSQQFDVSGKSDQHLVVFTAEPDSPSHEALKLLAQWANTPVA